MYGVATRGLRVLVRALYLFPLLVVVKIVLYAMHVAWGDYITVGFVGLVVALFGMFVVVMLLMAIAGPRPKSTTTTLVFFPPKPADAERIIAEVVPSPALRMTGRVDAGLDEGAVVLEEHWGDNGGTIVRFFEGSSFVVFPDGASPVVVELEACPVVLARYDAGKDHLAVPGIGAVAPLGHFVLRQGERVEIVASQAHPGTHPVLQNSSALTPYREAESTMKVTSTTDRPIVIRSLA